MRAGLQPMSLGEILDRTFQIYRTRFRIFFVIATMPAVLLTALQLTDLFWWHLRLRFQPHTTNPVGQGVWNVLLWLALYHISIVVHSVFVPALLKASSDNALGESSSLKEALRFAYARGGRFLWLGILQLFTVLIASEAAMGALFYGMGTGMDAMGLLNGDRNWAFIALLCVPLLSGISLFLWMTGWFVLAMPACAFEDVRGFKALGRSWRLSRQVRWKIAGTWLLIFVLVLAVNWGMQSLVRWGFYLLWHAISHWALLRVAYTATLWTLYAFVAAVLGPVFPIALTLFYYDQRIRKEGFDVEWMMQAAGMVSEPDVAAQSAPAAIAVESETDIESPVQQA